MVVVNERFRKTDSAAAKTLAGVGLAADEQALPRLTAVVLAGGLGSRLRSVVSDRPKVLVPVRGKPFLTYLLEQLAAVGIRHVVLSTGYLGDRVRAAFGDTYQGIQLAYSRETRPLGTAGALRLALPLYRSSELLVLNGDSYCETDLRALWKHHRRNRADATILMTRMADPKRYGQIQINSAGRIYGFAEKGFSPRPGGWINAGIYVLSRRLLQDIPESRPVSLEREVFPEWAGRALYGYHGGGRFIDIGTPESLKQAEQFFDAHENSIEEPSRQP